ncbi:Proteasome/cyclosome repeat protein [Snodgrassella alvi SCGC AB-598-O02]|nr:Proteasome/cyclosome repeat protein [Snodgrassella alvi SCGC AB-598-O02]
MVKGVQPEELITAIFEKEYTKIETYKEDNLIFLVLTFSDTYENDTSNITMKYVYNRKKELVSISQKINSSNYKEQWNRKKILEAMINELIIHLPKDNRVIEQLKTLIPDDYKPVFSPYLKIAC